MLSSIILCNSKSTIILHCKTIVIQHILSYIKNVSGYFETLSITHNVDDEMQHKVY